MWNIYVVKTYDITPSYKDVAFIWVNILHNICLEHMLCLVENFSLIFVAQVVLMSKQRWVISEHQVLFEIFNLKLNPLFNL
jgi:hypothetical protein